MLSEEQTAIQDMARNFSMEQMAPHAATWDEQKIFPVDVLRQMAGLGFAGIYLREEHGGSGLSRFDAALIFEALSAGCTSTAAFMTIHNMASWMIDSFGSDDQRSKYVPRLTSMELIASYCLTEPGSGSDASAMRSRAVRDGDAYVLNGSKAFISGAGVSDVYVAMIRTGDDGPKGVSCFIIEKDTPGLSFGANERKMGWHSQPTAQVIFEDCRVPLDNRIGEEGEGFKFAMMGLDGGRLNIAACSLGTAQRAFDKALAYAQEREQFGQNIAAFQAIQFKLADMATDLEAARLMLYSAAQSLDAGDPQKTKKSAMAKRFVTDTCFNVANEALQIHGGYGYLQDYEVERMVRDLRVHQILEGTNEIMRVIISRALVIMTEPQAEVLFHQSGASGVITMNRPQALNALTLNMVRLILPQLRAWASDETVEHVIIEGAGEKGFCAGGDIRALHDWGQANAPEATLFYREEYVLNRLIKTYPKPYIALIDGITMGGGVGMSVHGAYRVATEATVFAMPETGIGLLPDVGGTYFLPRLPGQIGAYMVLTGARLKAADTLYAGIATHYTPASDLEALKTALSRGGDVGVILDSFRKVPDDSPLAALQSDIDRLFAGDGVTDIIAALAGDGSDWASQQKAAIETKSPTSAAVALRQMRDGAQADFDEAMRIEMRAVTRLMSLPDFYEGVRAIIIEKDNAPRWSPARHEDVTAADIDRIFAPLGDDELVF